MAEFAPLVPVAPPPPVGPLSPLWTLDSMIRDLLGLQPDPRNPFVAPVAQVVQGVPVGQLVAQQQPVIPPMWLADP